jgi:hypothetical protein
MWIHNCLSSYSIVKLLNVFECLSLSSEVSRLQPNQHLHQTSHYHSATSIISPTSWKKLSLYN